MITHIHENSLDLSYDSRRKSKQTLFLFVECDYNTGKGVYFKRSVRNLYL